MKNNFNTLHKYVLDYSQKEYRKETVDGLFRSILEPLIANQKLEACVLLCLNDIENKQSVIKRLSFSCSDILSFNNKLSEFNLSDLKINDIWGNTEFLLILSQRYSAALIWDYDLSDKKNYTPVCLLYNSKIISDIAKKIGENSSFDLFDLIKKFNPDRRENMALNTSIAALSAILNEKNEEIIFSEHEKKNMISADDTLKTAAIVEQKAKFIAHEIKNNLSVINLYSAIAEKRTENLNADETVIVSLKNALKNISNASENVSSLITDLRCLSSPFITELNIKKIILNTVMMCEEKANSSGVKIEIDYIDDIVVSSDKTKLECALTNVIYNAIEACKSGCVIKISCNEDNGFIKITVRNDGEKIPEELQEKIFESDFTTKEKGNGLGLDICRRQLALTGGTINLVSSDDSETVFEIAIPR